MGGLKHPRLAFAVIQYDKPGHLVSEQPFILMGIIPGMPDDTIRFFAQSRKPSPATISRTDH